MNAYIFNCWGEYEAGTIVVIASTVEEAVELIGKPSYDGKIDLDLDRAILRKEFETYEFDKWEEWIERIAQEGKVSPEVVGVIQEVAKKTVLDNNGRCKHFGGSIRENIICALDFGNSWYLHDTLPLAGNPEPRVVSRTYHDG